MAKAQGLPLSFIVLAAISVLVLILIVAFTVGGAGSFFKQITIVGGGGKGEELSAVQTACTANCQKLQADPTLTIEKFQGSDYCKKTSAVDLNKDGKIDRNETGLHCWDDKINIDCTVEIAEETITGKNNCTTKST